MHVQTVAKYIRRSPYQSIAAILIMSLTFLSIAAFSILTIISIRIIDYFEGRPQLSVFFKQESSADEVNKLKDQLNSTGKAQSIKFVSQEEALSIYKQQNKEDPLLLDLVTADILPASLDVQATDAVYLSELAQISKGSPAVDEVVFQKDIVDTLIKFTNGLRQIGIVIISILLVVSTFVILTIIGIKITVRKDEIEIMKLIGASNWFIRTPFLLEGIFYGAIGAIIGWGVSYGVLYFYATPKIESFFGNVPVLPIEPILMVQVLGILLVSAIFLGVFSSFLAVLRYLK
ncbi:MAG: permease-like cell division protein FtsX [Candidatus Levybacteria bacterium]|nr:permease-like cell division protein FtsX [Candidatus Levybacteria bacterium]